MTRFATALERPARKILPRSLLGRSLLIILVPLLVVQAVALLIFYGSHLNLISRRLSGAVAGEIAQTISLLHSTNDAADRTWILSTALRDFELRMHVLPGAHLRQASAVNILGPMDDDLAIALQQRVGLPFTMDWESRPLPAVVAHSDEGRVDESPRGEYTDNGGGHRATPLGGLAFEAARAFGRRRWCDDPRGAEDPGRPGRGVEARAGGPPMKLGALLMPSHPPERSIADGQAWDLDELRRLDDLGFDEAWVGEHFTAAWEPCPAPDLLIARALLLTRRIRLGPLGHLLPYHHPVELAHRVAYLDHMAAGRYQLGVGISALPSDHQLFGVDVAGGRNRRMTFESLDLMTRLWTEGPSAIRGEFWSMGDPRTPFEGLGYHLRPYQRPHPPIAIAGLTPGSENHKLAGEKGYIPVSLSISPDPAVTAGHWDAVVEGARRSGRTPDRADWRVIRDVYVAPTDAEARELAVGGAMGRCWREFLLPLYLGLGLGPSLKLDPGMPDGAVDLDFLADHVWLVGSPETVAGRILDLQARTGGFGHLLIVCHDATGERAAWERNLRLLVEEVLPRCRARPGADAGGRG